MKKFLAALLALSLTFGSVALPVAESGVIVRGVNISASAEMYGDYEYEILDDGTVEINKYTGEGGSVVIPSVIDGRKVTSIGKYAFRNNSSISSIKMPNSITHIGDWAFDKCSNLTNISLSDDLTEICYSAFSNCSSLVSITIPKNVVKISSAFSRCTSLESVIVDPENNYFSSEDGVLFDKNKSTLLLYPAGRSQIEYTIPDGVISVGSDAFENCVSLESITIPNSVTTIDSSAFMNCIGISSIVIPSSVTSIGDCAFFGCFNLADIEIPNSVTHIGGGAFENTAWLSKKQIDDPFVIVNNILVDASYAFGNVVIPDGVTSISKSAFSHSKPSSVTIPGSIETIEADIFNYDGINDVTILDGVKRIDNAAFWYSTLTSITIPNSVESIGSYAFSTCFDLKSITIPSSVKSIGDFAFENCRDLSDLTISDGVSVIGESAFSSCNSLKTVTIPDSVTKIKIYAFSYCENLTDVNFVGSRARWFEIYTENDESDDFSFHVNFHYGKPHVYVETITKEPDCWEEGEKTFTCECGEEYTETIPKTDHNYEVELREEPTCTEDGYVEWDCTICEDWYTETIPAKGHTEVIDVAVPATCTTDGKTEGSHCSVCGEVIKAQTVIKATGHNFGSWSTTKSATCTESGTQTRKCAACGKTETKTIPAKGHTSSSWIIDKQPAVGVKGSKHKECTVCHKVLETAEIPALSVTDISGASVKLSTNSYTYNGKAKKPAATVTLNGKTLKKDVDYTVKYSFNTAIGNAKVTITGKGNYKGTVSKTFKILPAKQTIAKITSQKKGFAVKWTKDTNVTGYQIQYDVKSDLKSAKSAYVKSNTTYKKTISGLKAKKTYYVRVRSYKTVGGVKYYGSWSAVKSVKTK